jgi:hypothetical protein
MSQFLHAHAHTATALMAWYQTGFIRHFSPIMSQFLHAHAHTATALKARYQTGFIRHFSPLMSQFLHAHAHNATALMAWYQTGFIRQAHVRHSTALSIPTLTCRTILFRAWKRWHICLRVFHSRYKRKWVTASFIRRCMCVEHQEWCHGARKFHLFPYHPSPSLIYAFLFDLSLSSPPHTEYYICRPCSECLGNAFNFRRAQKRKKLLL